jgi:hypothetical protein
LDEKNGKTPQRYPDPKHEGRKIPLEKESGKKEAENAADNQKDQAENQRTL